MMSSNIEPSATNGIHHEGGTIGGRSPRFTYWAAFLLFSTITLGAAVEEIHTNRAGDQEGRNDQNWAVACSSITFAITFIVTALQFHHVGSALFVGTKIEGLVILILTAFWAATVSIVSDARNGLAVSGEDAAVTNGNLYYFSWAGFICSVMLMISYLRGVFNVDVAGEIRSRSARLMTWSALLAAQLVVMGAAANIFDQDCAPRTDEPVGFCTRTIIGVAIGAIGTAMSLAIVGMKIATSSAPFFMEATFSCFLSVLNAVGVGFLTSPKGPGSPLGNLYYFSWLSLFASVSLGASCFEDYRGNATAGTVVVENEMENDIQVEVLDEEQAKL